MDTAKVRIKRTKTGDEAVTGFTYFNPKTGGTDTFECDAAKSDFEMSAAQAAGAVATGCFEVHPDSKSIVEVEQAEREAEQAELKAAAEKAAQPAKTEEPKTTVQE